MKLNTFISDFWGIWPIVPGTLLLSIVILLLGILIGSGISHLKTSSNHVSRFIASLYVTYFRGIPLLIHLFIVYYGLPVLLTSVLPIFIKINVIYLQRLNPIYAILITYSLYSAAFLSEIIRGSFRSVPGGQIEAARAMGYTGWQTYVHISLPQALVEATPKLLNYYLLLLRQLSLAFLVSFVDIFAQAQLQSAINYRYIEAYVAAAFVYWILSIVLNFIFKRFENRISLYRRGDTNIQRINPDISLDIE